MLPNLTLHLFVNDAVKGVNIVKNWDLATLKNSVQFWLIQSTEMLPTFYDENLFSISLNTDLRDTNT